ncbi:MAG: alanine racemase [Bacteroidales bacterium]
MAFIELNQNKLQHNFDFLEKLFRENGIEWGIVTKMLCGNKDYIKLVLDLGIKQALDSRISNLKIIKSINPEIETIYIKPPAKRSIRSVVKYADISMNTEYETIRLISEEAQQQNKNHKIIIMVEMGDLREGVMGEELVNFYGKIFELPNIEVVGLGTNLNCLNGVMPNHDKLVQLSLYVQLIEAKFNKKIPLISGGSSVTIPLVLKHFVPERVNHFRIGETLYNGKNLENGEIIDGMKTDLFMLHAEIIELTEKPLVPYGEMGTNVAGHSIEINEEDYGKTSYRAILDVGLLDIGTEDFTPVDQSLEISGASSDMIVLDLGTKQPNYKVGDLISFRLNYMGMLTVLNSSYITKKIV